MKKRSNTTQKSAMIRKAALCYSWSSTSLVPIKLNPLEDNFLDGSTADKEDFNGMMGYIKFLPER